jgi:F-type H+-transporting ATPase subunit b
MFLNLALLMIFASEGGAWWDYPGFELWKFVNLFVFVAILIFLVKRRVGEAFKTRSGQIKTELQRAQQERDAALAKLKEVEERLARLDTEVTTIRAQSQREAAEERERIVKSTEQEIVKLGEQAKREIESAGKAAKHDLRAYAAETSVRIAEDIIRREMRPEDDVRLISRSVDELGGAPQ